MCVLRSSDAVYMCIYVRWWKTVREHLVRPNFFARPHAPAMARGYGAGGAPSGHTRPPADRQRLDSNPLWDHSRTLLTPVNPVVAAQILLSLGRGQNNQLY